VRLPDRLAGVVELTDEDLRAALLLGAARELTNELAGIDTQNNPIENAEGHFLGALAEAAFAKQLDKSSDSWMWHEPLRLAGGRATRGPSGGDFAISELSDQGMHGPLEIKSVAVSKPEFNLNMRKLARAIAGGVVWLPVTLCPALAHACAAAPFRPIDSLASAVQANRNRTSRDWRWHQARFHPDEFGQSYLAITSRALAGPQITDACTRVGCRADVGRGRLAAAPQAVVRLRTTDPSRWPRTGITELIDVTSYATFLEWWRACRRTVRIDDP
jgi:hypothetical protein